MRLRLTVQDVATLEEGTMWSAALRILAVLVLVSSLALSALASPASAQTGAGAILATAFPSITVEQGKSATFSVDLVNNGPAGRLYKLEVTGAPQGWETTLKALGMIVHSIYVLPTKTQSFDVQVRPPQDAKGKTATLVLRAVGADGAEDLRLSLSVAVAEGVPGATKLVTNYPRLRGQVGSRFSFKLDLANEATEERLYSLTSNAPQGWNVAFKPAYESTQISSLRLKANDSKGIDVEVESPQNAPPGEHQIAVQAAAGADRAQQALTVQLTGVHKLALNTQTGLLNTAASAGEDKVVTLAVDNPGSAELQNVALSSAKPDGWSVTFSPDKLDVVPAGGSREVQMTIRPSNKAIAGDYLLRVSASTPQASDNKELRVQVETPTAWGLVGAGVVVLAVGGLLGIFRRFGRR